MDDAAVASVNEAYSRPTQPGVSSSRTADYDVEMLYDDKHLTRIRTRVVEAPHRVGV